MEVARSDPEIISSRPGNFDDEEEDDDYDEDDDDDDDA